MEKEATIRRLLPFYGLKSVTSQCCTKIDVALLASTLLLLNYLNGCRWLVRQVTVELSILIMIFSVGRSYIHEVVPPPLPEK